MSQTETKLLTSKPKEKSKPTNISELRTVQWVSNVGLVKGCYDFSAHKYDSAKRMFPVLTWIFATIEMFFLHIYLFIHNLPWPDWIMNIILRFDQFLENFLEFMNDKLEWWWDNMVVRLMWLRDMIESVIDGLLSLGLFIVYKVIDFWMWGFSVALGIIKIIFAPIIWIANAVLPPAQKKISNTSSVSSDFQPGHHLLVASNSGSAAKQCEADDYMSGSVTSDCDSDVSVVSETWSIGHTDKHGKSYNRVQMKATAEGRLRAAMYKRVKAQLTLMRKNSISFSRGMTSYIRQILSPESKPALTSLRNWINNFTKDYGYEKLFDGVFLWLEDHDVIAFFASLYLSIARIPLNVVQNLLNRRKKKSRRTRSMRSESFRRRTVTSSAVVNPPFVESYGMSLSKEPVEEEPEFCSLQKVKDVNDSPKLEEDGSRDSALASSIDDLCLASESNDSVPTSRDKMVLNGHKEGKELVGEFMKEEKDKKPSHVNGADRKPNSNPNKKSIERKGTDVGEPNGKKEFKRLQNINENEPKSSATFEETPDERGSDAVPHNHKEKRISASLPVKSNCKKDKNTYAEATNCSANSHQNGVSKNQNDQEVKSVKPPKRKISFSLTS